MVWGSEAPFSNNYSEITIVKRPRRGGAAQNTENWRRVVPHLKISGVFGRFGRFGRFRAFSSVFGRFRPFSDVFGVLFLENLHYSLTCLRRDAKLCGQI